MTSKQRAYLRSLANTMEPIIHVGKDGVNENMIKQASDALEARELIKRHGFAEQPDERPRRDCRPCEGTNAEPVQCIGSRFVIYRAREKRPEDRASVRGNQR